MERRDLIKGAAGLAAATGLAPGVADAAPAPAPAPASGPSSGRPTVTSAIPEHPDMKYRALGVTGERVSLVGLGGYHLAKPGGMDAAEAVRVARAAIDAGINFCDNCWDYNGGESEIRLGRALRDGYRDRVFLMTKLDGRTAEAATGQLAQSLERLQTDHIDLVQFHEVIRMDDPERIFAKGGALEAILRARDAGTVRYIGFTGHKSPAIHAHMFAVAEAHGFRFDTVQMPLNVMDAHYDSFQQTVIPIALRQRTAIMGMKAFGDNFILKSNVMSPIEMLRYPMSLPISIQITGIDGMPILAQALEAVRGYVPPTSEQTAALLARTAAVAATGRTERYKTTHFFDGTWHNPRWLTEA